MRKVLIYKIQKQQKSYYLHIQLSYYILHMSIDNFNVLLYILQN